MAKTTTTTRTGVGYFGDVGACDFEATAEGDGVTGRAEGSPVRAGTPPAAVTAASAAAEGNSAVEPALEGNSAPKPTREGTESTDTMNTGNTIAFTDFARLATQRPVTLPEAVAVAAAAAKLQSKARGSPSSSRRSSSASSSSAYRSLLAMPALDALKG
ncbi:unnamed protein product, partial [Ectocarpus fasciculatus]